MSIGRRAPELHLQQNNYMQSNEMDGAPGDWNDLWATVGDGLLGGLHHALNNRVAALSAISQVLGSGMPDAAPLIGSLSAEVARLEEMVGLLAYLRRSRAARPEPVQLPEMVAGLAPLLAQHGELKEIVFVANADPGVLPAWGERDLLTRVLLTLMVAVGIEAAWGGCRRVRVTYRGDEVAVAVRVACERTDGAASTPDPSVQRLDARAAAAVARGLGGELEAKLCSGGETAYELRLPTLLQARREAVR